MKFRSSLSLALVLVTSTLSAQHTPREVELGLAGPVVRGGGSPSATTASYSLFGDSCGTACAALNDTRAALRTGTLPNEYAFGYQFPSATTVVGFQLYTKTVSLPLATMTCSLFRQSTTLPGQPDVTPVATGSMTVTGNVDFYTVVLNAPVAVAAGETIWIHQSDATNIVAAGLASAGTTPTVKTYYRRTGVAWTSSVIVTWPAWRILCSNNLVFSNSAEPKLGTSISLDLRGGPAGTIGVVFFGIGNPNAPTPFCGTLLASPDVSFTIVTDPNGNASFPVAIPNNPALDGGTFYNQIWVVGASQNLLGSNGGFGTLGT